MSESLLVRKERTLMVTEQFIERACGSWLDLQYGVGSLARTYSLPCGLIQLP